MQLDVTCISVFLSCKLCIWIIKHSYAMTANEMLNRSIDEMFWMIREKGQLWKNKFYVF